MYTLRYSTKLEKEIEVSRAQIVHLKALEKCTNNLVQTNRILLSEISSYPKPPQLVKTVMTATFVILGESFAQANVSKLLHITIIKIETCCFWKLWSTKGQFWCYTWNDKVFERACLTVCLKLFNKKWEVLLITNRCLPKLLFFIKLIHCVLKYILHLISV